VGQRGGILQFFLEQMKLLLNFEIQHKSSLCRVQPSAEKNDRSRMKLRAK
jgi:hypothetical protein